MIKHILNSEGFKELVLKFCFCRYMELIYLKNMLGFSSFIKRKDLPIDQKPINFSLSVKIKGIFFNINKLQL